jgi:hypothetical protein
LGTAETPAAFSILQRFPSIRLKDGPPPGHREKTTKE